MRIFKEQAQIEFVNFAKVLPKEASLLKNYQGHDVELELDQDNKLSLLTPHSGPISFSIAKELAYHRHFFIRKSIYNEPLAKALGVKRGEGRPCVLDATAGSLKDSLLIYSLGCRLYACERHPVVQALIINAIDHCAESLEGFKFYAQNVFEWIEEHKQKFEECHVIYFDPMYEQKNEKALPRKEMRILREIVGKDSDARETALLLKKYGKRLVIKQSAKASPLLESPTMTFGSKSTRYNVYL